MRAEGMDSHKQTIGYVDALTAVGIESESGVYWSGRACLVIDLKTSTPMTLSLNGSGSQRAGELTRRSPKNSPSQWIQMVTTVQTASNDGTQLDAPPPIELRFSSAEILRQKDFAEWTDAELAESQRLMRQLRFIGSPRRSLRLTPTPRSGSRRLRRTVRSVSVFDGEPIRQWLPQVVAPRRLVLPPM